MDYGIIEAWIKGLLKRPVTLTTVLCYRDVGGL